MKRSSRPALLVAFLGLIGAAEVAAAATQGSRARMSPTTGAQATEPGLVETLHAPRYKFCHDATYPLTAEEVRWCALLPSPPDPGVARCPAFLQACARGATAKVLERQKPFEFKLPSFGGLGRWLFLAMLAVAIAVAATWVARSLVGRRGSRIDAGDGQPAPAEAVSATATAAAAVERDVARLLARARAAAAAGDYGAAINDLYAALLRRLDGDGHVRIHPSATNGDYLRELRGRAPALVAPVGAVAVAVEGVQFGATVPGDEVYRSIAGRVTELLDRGKALGLVLALVMTASLSCNSSLRTDWRDSPSGSAAVSAFLTASGIETHERLRSLAELDKASSGARPAGDGEDKQPGPPRQLAILPDGEVAESDWITLQAAVKQGRVTMVVAGPRKLPDWIDVEQVPSGASGPVHVTPDLNRWRRALAQGDDDDDDGAGGSSAAGRERDRAAAAADRALSGRIPDGGWVNVGKPAVHQVLVRHGNKPYAVALDVGQGHVIVLGDGALYTNAALAVADNAAILRALLGVVGGPLEVVTQETGLIATTPLQSVSRGRLAPFMAQLGAFLILLFLLKGAAFGRLMDRQSTRRRRFGEHVEALGLQYARARAARHASVAYAAWTVERLRERIHLPGDRGLGDLASAVAARTGRPLGEVARLLFHAHRDDDAARADEPRTRAAAAEHLATIAALGKLLSDARGGRTTTGHTRQGETKS